MVDRLVLAPDMRTRVAQSVEQALEVGGGIIGVYHADTDEVHMLSQRYASMDNPDIEIPELEPRLLVTILRRAHVRCVLGLVLT